LGTEITHLQTLNNQEVAGMIKRSCERFVIFGAKLSFKKGGFLCLHHKYTYDCYPILDLSYGGLRFLTQDRIKMDTKLTMKIYDPNDKVRVTMKGKVTWTSRNPGQSYAYQIGVQFSPYGEKGSQNHPDSLDDLVDFERKFYNTFVST